MIIKPAYMEAFKYIYSQIKEPKYKKMAMKSLIQFLPPDRIDEMTGVPFQTSFPIYKDTDDLQRNFGERFLEWFFQYHDDIQQQIITNLFEDIPVDSYASIITECIGLAIEKDDSEAAEEHLHKIQEIVQEQYDKYYEKMLEEQKDFFKKSFKTILQEDGTIEEIIQEPKPERKFELFKEPSSDMKSLQCEDSPKKQLSINDYCPLSENPLKDMMTLVNQAVFRFVFDKAPQEVRDKLINEIEPFIKHETIYKLAKIDDPRLRFTFFDCIIPQQPIDRQKEIINDIISDVPYSVIADTIDGCLMNYPGTKEEIQEFNERVREYTEYVKMNICESLISFTK